MRLVHRRLVTDLERARGAYAEMVSQLAGVRSHRIVDAFAAVPRERFLGPGPWRIIRLDAQGEGYHTTPSADPSHLYQNVLVALDESRVLNNGEPAALARWFDLLDPREGDHVLHVGCGVGYYTAILAEGVGPSGRVTALEIDAGLAERARSNLSDWRQAEVLGRDASDYDPGPCDAIFVNAGVTRLAPAWLARLRPGGRLLVPLTVALEGMDVGLGHMLHLEYDPPHLTAAFSTPVAIYHCAGLRSDAENDALDAAFKRGGEDRVRRLRTDAHAAGDSCWLHAPGFCLAFA